MLGRARGRVGGSPTDKTSRGMMGTGAGIVPLRGLETRVRLSWARAQSEGMIPSDSFYWK